MNPDLPLYGAIANAEAREYEIDLGDGLLLRRCSGFIWSQSLFAFSPPPGPGLPHPAPWVAVKGNNPGFDIALEIIVPQNVRISGTLDRLNLVWFIPHLLRLRQKIPLFVPAVSNSTFSEPSSSGINAEIVMAERLYRRWWAEHPEGAMLTDQTLGWVQQNWKPALQLWSISVFRNLMEAFDVLALVAKPSQGLVLLFGALESLFLAGMEKGELTFRLSAYVAAYLEPPGQKRIDLQEKVKRLYAARSRAAHGTKGDPLSDLRSTEDLFRRILVKIIEEKAIPTDERLKFSLFGDRDYAV